LGQDRQLIEFHVLKSSSAIRCLAKILTWQFTDLPVYWGMVQVIELTYDLLKTAKQAEASNVVLLETDLDSPSLPKSQEDPPVSRFRPQQVCISHML
jgi:hypothetical protein